MSRRGSSSTADFRAANFDTGTLDRILGEMDLEAPRGDAHVDAAVVVAAILAFEESQSVRLPQEESSRWRAAARSDSVGRERS